jgi:hypothetical protein
MRYAWLLIGGILFGLLYTPPAEAKSKSEPLVEKVRKAIQGGIKYLRSQQLADGSWEIYQISTLQPGGTTALALLALLNAGVPPEDKMVKKGLEYLRKIDSKHTYVTSLQTMVYAEARQTADSIRIQRNVDWLIDKAAVWDGGKLLGWSYGTTGRSYPDNSNSQYAVLALHAGRLAGARIKPQVWEAIRNLYLKTQTPEGGWIYSTKFNSVSYLTMDVAGLTGLIISGLELNKSREKLIIPARKGASVHADNCGGYKENEPVRKALDWITRRGRFDIQLPNKIYYNLYGIERIGRLSGERFLANHDWYREGCEFLVEKQNKGDGYWPRGDQFDQWPLLNTSFALLFLSKGRTPVLISKLAHGRLGVRYAESGDWNNDRNDIKHLVEYASQELFKRQPLAWQVFDGYRGKEGRRGESEQDALEAVTAELLQSPIAYFNGHKAPEFTSFEKDMLRQYVDNGGFVIAEACCGKEKFDQGFRKLVKELFPDNELQKLDAGHPVWTAFYKVDPGEFPLMGIKRGCKTVLIYSPTDLSCLWESNDLTNAKAIKAFRLGANIITYATGLEKPPPRLDPQQVIRDDKQKEVPRNAVRVAQLKYGPDWEPAPNAMRILLDYMDQETRIRADRNKAAIEVDNRDIRQFPFLYMHGNKRFAFKKDQLEDLRFNLERKRYLLFADACCGSAAFDESFRAFMKQLFPDKNLEKIPVEKEPLYSEEVNGEKIDDRNIRCRITRSEGNGKGAGFRSMAPALEGIKVEGRWVVIYSKYDIGCALEKHSSPDCLGYDHQSALRLGKAAVLYALKQ